MGLFHLPAEFLHQIDQNIGAKAPCGHQQIFMFNELGGYYPQLCSPIVSFWRATHCPSITLGFWGISTRPLGQQLNGMRSWPITGSLAQLQKMTSLDSISSITMSTHQGHTHSFQEVPMHYVSTLPPNGPHFQSSLPTLTPSTRLIPKMK